MDNLFNTTSLALFIAFVVPGFIAQKVYALIVPDDTRDSSSTITSAVAYSSLSYAITSPLVWWVVKNHDAANQYLVVSALLLIWLVVPALLPIGWIWLRRRPFMLQHTLSPVKRPWDYVFNGRNDYWVIVTFKNGEKIGGVYGQNSFSSAYPRREQIYLQKVWVLADDGSFVHEAEGSKGAIILSDEILTIELFSSLENRHE